MLKLVVIFWILTVFCNKTYSDCSFSNFQEASRPIFSQTYGLYEILSTAVGNTINVEEDQYLYLYCPTEIRVNVDNEKIPWVGIHCENGVIKYINYIQNRNYNHRQLIFMCDKNVATFFETRIPFCDHDGYFYGYNFSYIEPIALAEFCYNFDSLETIYIHYVAGHRPSALQRMYDFNPNKRKYYNTSMTKVATLPGLSTEIIGLEFFLNDYYNVRKYYEIGELVPFGSNAIEFKNYLASVDANRVVWWSSLKNGNWAIYSKILQTKSMESTFEIFAGKSGQTKHPHNDCELEVTLTYKVEEKEKTVPLYIWNYIIPRNDYNNSFVIIGVNSPFLELKSDRDNETIFCNNMCDEIEWLKPLERTRRMQGMGYMFCCRPDEVENILYGFPKIKYPLGMKYPLPDLPKISNETIENVDEMDVK